MVINSAMCKPELWAGMECTINRVGDYYRDQLADCGHYTREDDLRRLADLDIKALRYPVLWEHHQPEENGVIDWHHAHRELTFLKDAKIKPIIGLLHHGSGPRHTSLIDPWFPEKFAAYALAVAKEFPDMQYYTPINEPLTTARFSGLYGFWYPHHKSPLSFVRILFNQVKGVVLAMKAIRSINPDAKLIQTEDLGKTHSRTILQYQADFENHRRWLTFDLLCGKLIESHPLWSYLIHLGLDESELRFFSDNTCPPDVLGLNYYVTSERFLDEGCESYPASIVGGNGIDRYVDTEAVRAGRSQGLPVLLREAWTRFGLPMAITEAHLACTREEQMRWLKEIWNASCEALTEGVPVKAVTAWTTFGAYDWNS
ncbi:MAG TPA: family 1 glycosylhydrolase, partial [Chryseosolibacter sp.]|nr:family 1 glycosylhydrolase [Chryseosolibacter sp.]